MKILNFGSLNLDYTYQVPHIVQSGETLTSTGLQLHPGGKGLNQSIALAKAGANVYHAGQIGEDGIILRDICEKNQVCTKFIRVSETRSGNAVIQVDRDGRNGILLYPGANRCISRNYMNRVLEEFGKGDVLLLQNEINDLAYLIERAAEKGMIIVLNPSPMDEQVLACDLQKVSLFILNEIEGKQMTGEEEPMEILEQLRRKYSRAEIVLTLGEKGAIYSGYKGTYRQEAFRVKVKDTTGAGDTFTGFFVAEYYESGEVELALRHAAMASAISVTREGAAEAIPTRKEIQKA